MTFKLHLLRDGEEPLNLYEQLQLADGGIFHQSDEELNELLDPYVEDINEQPQQDHEEGERDCWRPTEGRYPANGSG